MSDISGEQPYSSHVGTSLVLKLDSLICEYGHKENTKGDEYTHELVRDYGRKKCALGNTVAFLPKGTQITISSVEMNSVYSVKSIEWIYAFGKVQSDCGEEISFYYHLGITNFLEPAPWQDGIKN